MLYALILLLLALVGGIFAWFALLYVAGMNAAENGRYYNTHRGASARIYDAGYNTAAEEDNRIKLNTERNEKNLEGRGK